MQSHFRSANQLHVPMIDFRDLHTRSGQKIIRFVCFVSSCYAYLCIKHGYAYDLAAQNAITAHPFDSQ